MEMFALAAGSASELGWREQECLWKDSDATDRLAVMHGLAEREPAKKISKKIPIGARTNSTASII